MERKFRLLAGIVLISLILFTTCKTTENRNVESIHNKAITKSNKLPLAWIAGGDVTIDTLAASNEKEVWNKQMSAFYTSRNYEAVWLTNRQLNKNGEELFKAINLVWKDGLPCEAYNFTYLENKLNEYKELTLQEKDSLSFATFFDIELTKAYFKLAEDLANGLVADSVETPSETSNYDTSLFTYLTDAVNKKEVEKTIEDLKPKSEQYTLLKNSYLKLLAVKENDNWPLPGYFQGKLEEGDSCLPVIKVKRFLVASGDLEVRDSAYLDNPNYDDVLTDAVLNFQERHGLDADGIIGNATLAEMNVPLENRLDQIRVNLDRLRKFPDDLGKDYIAVNIPGFSLSYIKNNKPVTQMNVVVGSNEHATPVMKDTLLYLVFNPEWNVPKSIATTEILPKVKSDSTYLARNNYKVIPYEGASADVDWSEVSSSNFPYRIVQESGESNALGKVKFIMPNQQSIYLHDTPSKYLFNREQRNLSHGCIRLEEPVELAEVLLDGQLTRREIDDILDSKEPTKVDFEKPIPVHLFYQTAWVDKAGHLNFRHDIYKHDQPVLAELRKYEQSTHQKLLLAER